MPQVDVLGYITSKGLQYKRAGGWEINLPCPFHGEEPGKHGRPGRFYLNVDPDAEVPGLYFCLAAETEVLTWDGYRPIKDLAGSTQTVMTEGGRWVDAPIRSFGEQRLMRVELQRNKRTKVIYATPEHRWFVRSGGDRGSRHEVTTEQLRPRQALAHAYGQGVRNVRPSAFGMAQGVTFGDGTLVNGGRGAAICIYDEELERFFPLSPSSSGASAGGVPFTRCADLPAHFKRLPDLDDSRSFLYGWLAGYFAADGDVTTEGRATLWSADRSTLEFVELLCNRIGVGTFGVRGPYYGKGRFNDEPMFAISFLSSTLTEDFFVLSKHRLRHRVPATERKSWRVVSVEMSDRVEEVYCATVEGWGSFVIEGNILTGNCHVCNEKGNLVTLKRHFGDSVTPDEEQTYDQFEILAIAAGFYQRELAKNQKVIDYLHGPERGLTSESIKKFQLGYASMDVEQDVAKGTVKTRPSRKLYSYLRDLGYEAKQILATGLCVERGDRLVDSLDGMVTIPYIVAGNVVDIRGRSWPERDGSPKYKTCSGRDSRLYNTQAVWNVDEVVATEGEFDAMVMTQLGYNAVGFPGAKSWQDSWNGYFAPLKRVWMVFDRDSAGSGGFEKTREAIGPKARPVWLSEPGMKVDPTEWVQKGHTREDFERLLSQARRGEYLIDVQQAISEFYDIQNEPGLRFGWEILDTMINPGLQRSQVMIVLAKTGTGKTVLLLNVMDRMRRQPGQENLKILFFSLEQTRGEWWDRARRIYRFNNFEADDADAEKWWSNNIRIVDHNRLTEAEVYMAIEDFEYQMGQLPDLIALDYLGYFSRSYRGERYEATSAAVMAVKAMAKDLRVPWLVPHQVSRVGKDGEEFGTDAARDSGVIEETADFLLTMWSPDNSLGRSEDEKSGRIHVRIGKSRHGGRGMLINLQWAPLSLAMIPEGDPLCGPARQEFSWQKEWRDDWPKAVYRHRTGAKGHLERVPDVNDSLEVMEHMALDLGDERKPASWLKD